MTPKEKADAAKQLAENVINRCGLTGNPVLATDAWEFVGLFLVTMEEFQKLREKGKI